MIHALLLVLSTVLFPSFHFSASAFKITGATGGINPRTGIPPSRFEINQFAISGAAFDLYILALERFQSVSQTDPLSYFQIAGIHGWPLIAWDGVTGQGVSPGYCIHTSILFPIWHRPYLAVFEQILWTHAQSIAQTYPVGQRGIYQAAAATLRVPYWDWAYNATLPDVVGTRSIGVNSPGGYQVINNPLYQYQFHPGPESNGFPSDTVFASLNYTLRQPDSSLKVSNESQVTVNMLNMAPDILQKTYHLLSSPMSYSEISCTLSDGISSNPGDSIEGLHNDIHDAVGGASGGFMYYPEYAAFDPIFWLHHAQVDRLIAMWQTLNPGNYVQTGMNARGSYYEVVGTIETISSPLAPFHSDTGSNMHTAASVRNIGTLGYTYDDLNGLTGSTEQQQALLRSRINQLYNPAVVAGQRATTLVKLQQTSTLADAFRPITLRTAHQLAVNNLETQWSLRVEMDQNAYNTSFTINFFMGSPPQDVKQWSTASNLLGTYAAFTSFSPSTAVHQSSVPQVRGMVSLTPALAAAVARGFLENLSPNQVVPLLRKHLQWKANGPKYQLIHLGQLSGLKVMVQSRTIKASHNESEFPIYGKYKTYLEGRLGTIDGADTGGRF